jgi:hypothetical protein
MTDFPSPFLVTQLATGPIIEGARGATGLVVDAAGTGLLEACFSAEASGALLHAENLSAAFFDLSSRHAGELLQQLRKYGVRLAVLVPPEGVAMSSRFGEMVAEEQRGRDFRLCQDRDEAVRWLAEVEDAT